MLTICALRGAGSNLAERAWNRFKRVNPKTSTCALAVNTDIPVCGRLVWTGVSPTRSGPEGSSRNDYNLGRRQPSA